MPSKTTVVIPNWNGADFIAEALESLKKQTLKHEVIVVDNGSVDDSLAIIAKSFPEVKVLKFKDNAGFAGGVNRGIKPAIDNGAEYVVLFNNDAVASKDWLKNLVQAAKNHPKAGIITGKFMRTDKVNIDSTGDFYTIWGMPFPRGRNQKDQGQYDKPEYIFGATGGASLYKTKMLKQIGLFDEDFFAYFEDVDISMRAQLAGWKVWYQPTAIAYHRVSATSSKLGDFARFHSIKNFFLTWQKNLPLPILFLCLPLITLQTFRLFLTTLLRNRSALIFFSGIGASIKLLPSTIAKRHKIQKNRNVSIRYIWSILSKQLPPIIPKNPSTSL